MSPSISGVSGGGILAFIGSGTLSKLKPSFALLRGFFPSSFQTGLAPAVAMNVPFTYRNHGRLMARRRAWLRFVTNRFQLTDSFATHFNYDKWTRAFDANVSRLTRALPGAALSAFTPSACLEGFEPEARRPLPGLTARPVRALTIAGEMVSFRVRRLLAKRDMAC